MATVAFYRTGLVCSIAAFVCMFIAFASPYWYQSWRRVHSSFGNIGLWHVCLSGYIIPTDPVMKSYVGCWWIHSTEFSEVNYKLQPVWFRFIQAFCIFTTLADLVAMVLIALYIPEGMRSRLYVKRPRMFFINSALLLASAFLVFLIALVFAEKGRDSDWMPRPWMNYLSWSFGLCVLSGFFAGFGGMTLFILALMFKDKEDHGDPGVTSAAELSARRRELEKQDELMRQQGMGMDTVSQGKGPYGSGQVYHPGSTGQVYPSHVYKPGSTGQVYRPGSSGQVYKPGSLGYMHRPGQYQQQAAVQDKPDHGRYRPPAPRSQTGSQSSHTDSQGKRVGESFV